MRVTFSTIETAQILAKASLFGNDCYYLLHYAIYDDSLTTVLSVGATHFLTKEQAEKSINALVARYSSDAQNVRVIRSILKDLNYPPSLDKRGPFNACRYGLHCRSKL